MASRAPLPPGYPPTSGAVPQQDLVVQPESMGFSRELAEQAVLGTQGQSLQAALDWLLTLCQTPRPVEAAVATPRSTEEEELARAIEMSLSAEPATTAGPPPVMGQLSEEEQLELAISESLKDTSEKSLRKTAGPGWWAKKPVRSLDLCFLNAAPRL